MKLKCSLKAFGGSVTGKPSGDTTPPTRDTEGFKGLLHMLSVIVSLAKVSLDFYFLF